MNQDNFRKYLGKHLRVGCPNYLQKDAVFFYDGILKEINDDGILIQRDDKEVFLSYKRIIEFQAPSGGAWNKK